MKRLNLSVFVALMGTSSLVLASKLLFGRLLLVNYILYVFEAFVVGIFLYNFGVFLSSLFSWRGFLESLKNVKTANLYSAIPIASALIAMMFVKIGFPFDYNAHFAFVFWLVSAIFSLFFVVVIPITFKFRTGLKEVSGTWFIPPVGLFVLISAGAMLAGALPSLKGFMVYFNMLVFGPAFVLYFLTLSMLYLRTKVEAMPDAKFVPTFNIVLAPVGVSIMAVLLTSNILGVFFGLGGTLVKLSKIYSLVFFGYGLWVIFGLLLLYFRFIRNSGKIPFSELWWAFVFPVGAFTLASINLYKIFPASFFRIVSLVLYFVLLVLWVFVFGLSFKKKN